MLGVLTAGPPVGEIPPVTLCEQYNDLRADPEANVVFTYAFPRLDASDLKVQIDSPSDFIRVVREQDFEHEYHRQARDEPARG